MSGKSARKVSASESHLGNRIQNLEAGVRDCQQKLHEVMIALGNNGAGLKAENLALKNECQSLLAQTKSCIEERIMSMNHVIYSNGKNCQFLVDKVGARADEALRLANQAKDFLQQEKRDIRAAVDSFTGLDDRITKFVSDKVSRIEVVSKEVTQLGAEFEKSVFSVYKQFTSFSDRIDALEKKARVKNAMSRSVMKSQLCEVQSGLTNLAHNVASGDHVPLEISGVELATSIEEEVQRAKNVASLLRTRRRAYSEPPWRTSDCSAASSGNSGVW